MKTPVIQFDIFRKHAGKRGNRINKGPSGHRHAHSDSTFRMKMKTIRITCHKKENWLSLIPPRIRFEACRYYQLSPFGELLRGPPVQSGLNEILSP